MKTKTALTAFVLSAVLLSSSAHAQTLVSGSIQGTYDATGNPYIVTDHCTVPSGATLTLKPGVVVIIGPGLNMTVNGRLIAKGTFTDRIAIRGTGPAERWNRIFLAYSASGSEFTYCDFSDAQTALHLQVYNRNVLSVQVFNCTFTNCAEQGIYGEAIGYVHGNMGGSWADEPTLKLQVRNCVFDSGQYGCRFRSDGQRYVNYMSVIIARSYIQPMIVNSVFKNLSGEALYCGNGSYPGSSPTLFRNNAVYDCAAGVFAQEPYDVSICNNIFVQTPTAVRRTGALSSRLAYNCFWNCATNIIGYPTSYGQPLMTNRNGHSCDVAFNIFQEPGFADLSSMKLASGSAGVDAGDPAWQYGDCTALASMGTGISDLGPWGGPDAANWLAVTPLAPVAARMIRGQNAEVLQWLAIPRARYRVYYADSVPTNQWQQTTDGVIYASDALTTVNVVNDHARTLRVFKVESLGKQPSD